MDSRNWVRLHRAVDALLDSGATADGVLASVTRHLHSTGREPSWFSRAEAADALGVTVKRVDQLRAQGRLVWRRRGARQVPEFEPQSVRAYALGDQCPR